MVESRRHIMEHERSFVFFSFFALFSLTFLCTNALCTTAALLCHDISVDRSKQSRIAATRRTLSFVCHGDSEHDPKLPSIPCSISKSSRTRSSYESVHTYNRCFFRVDTSHLFTPPPSDVTMAYVSTKSSSQAFNSNTQC
jgi:hypothetical protein